MSNRARAHYARLPLRESALQATEAVRLAQSIARKEVERQERLNALDPDQSGDATGDTYTECDEVKADINEERSDDLSRLLAALGV